MKLNGLITLFESITMKSYNFKNCLETNAELKYHITVTFFVEIIIGNCGFKTVQTQHTIIVINH